MNLSAKYSQLPEPQSFLQGRFDKMIDFLVDRLPVRVYSVREFEDLATRLAGREYKQLIHASVESGLVIRQESVFCEVCREEAPCGCGAMQSLRDVRYVVKASPLGLQVALQSSHSYPYFISYHTADGQRCADELHDFLKGEGFLSSRRLITGDQWRTKIATGLLKAKVIFTIETKDYHERPVCQAERNIGFAAGCKVIRIGLCDRSLLNSPHWFDSSTQIDVYGTPTSFDLSPLLRMDELPEKPNLASRKDAARELVGHLERDAVEQLSDQLRAVDSINDNSVNSMRQSLLNVAFRSEQKASTFVKCFPLQVIDLD